MNARRVLTLIVLSLVGALILSGCSGAAPTDDGSASEATATVDAGPLTIAIAGMVTPASGLEYYMDLAKYMGRAAGREVRLIHKADYAEVNKMLADAKVDIAFVCSGPYVDGHDEFGLRLIAAPQVNGAPTYYSYIIVPRSSPATSLASLRGKIFAFTDPESNTGNIVPTFMLASMGEQPSTFFEETFFTYSHDNSIKAVATGDADGAAVDSLIWEYENATNPTHTAKTRIVQKSEPFAIPPVVARPGLDEAVFRKVRNALLTAYETPEGRALLDDMKIERFVTIDDSAYDSIRMMAEKIEE